MDSTDINNDNLWTVDWATADRQACLRSLPPSRPGKQRLLAGGIAATGLIGRDVSAMDRRSVKAQLAGRGDWRPAWWQLNGGLHRLLRPRATTEAVMYAFHQRHHFVTLRWLTFVRDGMTLASAIQNEGVLAGLRLALRPLPWADEHPEEAGIVDTQRKERR